MQKLARSLITQKTEAGLKGKGSRDVMSLISVFHSNSHEAASNAMYTVSVNANASENASTKLSVPEMVAQMQWVVYLMRANEPLLNFSPRTLMLAGHDTTANTLSWILYELSCHTDLQSKLRTEIREKIAKKGDSRLDEKDFESMPLLTSIVKVSTFISFDDYQFFLTYSCTHRKFSVYIR
jgi:hypothetical protein